MAQDRIQNTPKSQCNVVPQQLQPKFLQQDAHTLSIILIPMLPVRQLQRGMRFNQTKFRSRPERRRRWQWRHRLRRAQHQP